MPDVPVICSGKVPAGVVTDVATEMVAWVALCWVTVAVVNGGRFLTAKVMDELKPPLGVMATVYVADAPGATGADVGVALMPKQPAVPLSTTTVSTAL